MIKYYSQIESVPVDWLWYPYIPYGKITLIEGDPGDGKSSFILSLAAMISRGGMRPDGTKHEAESTIYQCNEDGESDTIRPRLEANNADCSKIAFIQEDVRYPLTLEDARIEEALKATKARLLVFDPIQSYLGNNDIQNVTAVRRQLFNINQLAMKYHCAVVFIGHMNKQSGQKNLYRSLGSIDIVAACRSVLAIERSQQKPMVRYIQHVKSSLAQEGSDLAFEIAAGGRIKMLGKVSVEHDEAGIKETYIRTTKKEIAEDYLLNWLSQGDLPAVKIQTRFRELDISDRIVNSAKAQNNIVSIKKKDGWYWHLEKETEVSNNNGTQQEITESSTEGTDQR